MAVQHSSLSDPGESAFFVLYGADPFELGARWRWHGNKTAPCSERRLSAEKSYVPENRCKNF
jgi:hypothetical protein